jgi:MraZ protein
MLAVGNASLGWGMMRQVAGQWFKGNGLSSVDPKGRLSVPAAFRQTIEARGGGKEILVSRHETDPCLVCYDRGYEETLQEDLQRQRRLEQERGAASGHSRRSRGAFGTADVVGWDSSGRIILPAFLKDRARIDATALFVAFGEGFEIWDPKTALAHDDEELRELAGFHLREKGGAA